MHRGRVACHCIASNHVALKLQIYLALYSAAVYCTTLHDLCHGTYRCTTKATSRVKPIGGPLSVSRPPSLLRSEGFRKHFVVPFRCELLGAVPMCGALNQSISRSGSEAVRQSYAGRQPGAARRSQPNNHPPIHLPTYPYSDPDPRLVYQIVFGSSGVSVTPRPIEFLIKRYR